MPTLVATPGDATANSYATVAEGDAFADTRLDRAAWSAATSDDKARALISASAVVDPLTFVGARTDDVQALAWPRTDALRPDRPHDAATDDIFYLDTEIPQRVKNAVCRLALAFIAGGTTNLFALDGDASVISKTVGPLSKTFDVATRAKGLARIDGVMDQLAPLLDTAAQGSGITMVRV